jgi:outer membrane lipoprotein SlyB
MHFMPALTRTAKKLQSNSDSVLVQLPRPTLELGKIDYEYMTNFFTVNRLLLLIIVSLATMGCATQPIIDTQGKSMAQYEQDLATCRTVAKQVRSGQKIAVGAAVGTVVGTALGAAVGNSESAQRGASVGAMTGAVKGGERARNERQRVIFNCLRNRGYAVLN